MRQQDSEEKTRTLLQVNIQFISKDRFMHNISLFRNSLGSSTEMKIFHRDFQNSTLISYEITKKF